MGSAASRSVTSTKVDALGGPCSDVECPVDPCQDCPIPVPVPPTGCFLLDGTDYIRKELSRGDNPEFGGSFALVKIDTHLTCTGPDLRSFSVQAYLVDRTPGRDGQILASGSVSSGGPGTVVGYGLIELYDEDYPKGRDAEVIMEWQATLWSGTWSDCGSVPAGLRQVRCEGVNTSTIRAGMGTGTFATGVVPPKRTFGSQTQSCYPIIQRFADRFDSARLSKVTFYASIFCRSGFAPQIQMVMDLYDRTPGQNNQPLTTRTGNSGTGQVTVPARNVDLFDRDYPKGSLAEVVIEATLTTGDGSTWGRCLSLPAGLQYARPCEGLETSTLKVFVGTGTFPTGVKQPPEECKQDNEPLIGMAPGTVYQILKVTPHVQYCGFFDWGSNSRITSVTKLAPTQIEILPIAAMDTRVCEVNFVPQGVDGTTSVEGKDGHFMVQVLFLTTPVFVCEGGFNIPKTITIDRTYLSSGTVVYNTPNLQ